MSIQIELKCPKHDFERFEIPVKRKFNVPSDTIEFEYKRKPEKDIRSIVIGRYKSLEEARDYLIEYYKSINLWNSVLSIKIL